MILYLIRGLPGSAKTTVAQSIGCLHLEMDMFFVNNGKYQFDGLSIPAVADACQQACEDALEMEMDVVVSNTFTRKWEMDAYVDLAEEYNAELRVYKCIGEFKNSHDVPEASLQNMKDRWEDFPGEIEITTEQMDKIYKREKVQL